MDADSVLQYDSLEKIVRPVLEDHRVVAVGGYGKAMQRRGDRKRQSRALQDAQ